MFRSTLFTVKPAVLA